MTPRIRAKRILKEMDNFHFLDESNFPNYLIEYGMTHSGNVIGIYENEIFTYILV